jgi:hypothetical protein
MKSRWREERTDRFKILHRDKFTCRYCGAQPGCDLLEVDHVVPVSRGGSDNECNKVTACKTCNARKSNAIIFPHDMIAGVDEDGWHVHKTFGMWSIVFSTDTIGVEKQRYGFIEGRRLFLEDWDRHMSGKTWSPEDFADMESAFACMRQMLADPRC